MIGFASVTKSTDVQMNWMLVIIDKRSSFNNEKPPYHNVGYKMTNFNQFNWEKLTDLFITKQLTKIKYDRLLPSQSLYTGVTVHHNKKHLQIMWK